MASFTGVGHTAVDEEHPISTGPARPWEDTTKPPRERAEALVAAMTLEQKIAQLHGAMETVDIYGMQERAKEEGADLDALAAQIRVERHVAAIDEFGIPGSASPTGRSGSAWATATPAPRPPRCR